jgi:hypothetical protein
MKTAIVSGARDHGIRSVQDKNGRLASHGWRGFAAAAVLFLVPWMCGCSTITRDTATASAQGMAALPASPAPGLSLDDIVTLSRQGVGADALIARIQVAGSYYRLSAAEIISLRERGVPVAVIDHLLTTERQNALVGSSQPVEKVQVRPVRKVRQNFVAALYHGF